MSLPTTSNTPVVTAHGLHARIGDNLYRLVDLGEGSNPTIQTAELQPPRIDTARNPEDLIQGTGVVFSMTDFKRGEGQSFLHREGSDADRYWSSRHLDVSPPDPGNPRHLTMGNTFEGILDKGGPIFLTHNGVDLFAAPRQEVDVYRLEESNLGTGGTADWIAEDPFAGETPGSSFTPLGKIISIGREVYVITTGDGVHKRDSSGTWTHWSNLEPLLLWSAKGRVLGSQAEELYDMAAGDNSELLHTLTEGESWNDVVDAGQFIVAGASDGVLYCFSLDEETASLSLASRIPLTFESSEEIIRLDYHSSGQLFVATEYEIEHSDTFGVLRGVRFYRMDIGQSGLPGQTTLIRDWQPERIDGSTNRSMSVGDTVTARHSIYFGLVIGAGRSDRIYSIWRYDLETGGLSEENDLFDDLHSGYPNTLSSLLSIGEWLFASVGSGAGYAVLREQKDTYVDSGYLISSIADHHTAEDKNWADVNLDIMELNGGEVELFYSTDPDAITDPDHASWISALLVQPGDGLSPRASLFETSRHLAVKLVLRSSTDNTGTPHVRAFSVRAYPTATELVMQLPINVSDQIEVPGLRRITAHRLGNDLYQALRNIEGSQQVVELFNPSETINGLVAEVSTPVMTLNARGSRTLVSMVQVRGRRVT